MRLLRFFAFFALHFLFSVSLFAQGSIQQASDQSQAVFEKVRSSIPTFSPSEYVNPFIGTGGHGHTFPGATAPFGMIQLSPDTRRDDWDGSSGYHYSDSLIYGFSHTHLSGTGVPDYCDLLLVPQYGKAKIQPGYQVGENGYGAKFSHQNEVAKPGYYSVKFENGTHVELIAGDRAGYHVYTFPDKKAKKFVLIDLDHRDRVLESSLEISGKQLIKGKRISQSWANEQHFYFALETSIPFKKAKRVGGNGQNKWLLEFPRSAKTVMIRVGISAVDEAGAMSNLKAELTDWNKDGLRAKTVSKWNKELSKILVSTENPENMTIFYTALYHSFIAPNLFSDSDGRYRGRDNQIHSVSDGQQYTVFSLWDTYRGANPLFTITQQKRTNEFIQTFLRQYKEGGDLPVWELAGNETECMIGYHSVSVIADAYVKGIQDYDANLALEAMKNTARLKEYAKDEFHRKGYISSAEEPESVSKTLEYAYDDFCIAQMAKAMGQDSIYKAFYPHSFNFVNVFDPSTQFMRARRSGQWFMPFNPTEVNFNYTEANSWQYSFAAPQHVELMANLFGGRSGLEKKLDSLFQASAGLSGREQADITGLIGQYAHGNEPSHHIAYLYNYTQHPEKGQRYIRQILKEMYHNAPDGLSGNEDCGQMSAWYVLSALGFYPITPGTPFYETGIPLFEASTIRLENGNTIQIRARNFSPKNTYVHEVTWNGVRVDKRLDHNELMKGGTLVFILSDSPLKITETLPEFFKVDVPEKWLPAPFITTTERVFEDKLKVGFDMVSVNSDDLNFIFYQIDDETWETYEKPFFIDKSCTIRFRGQRRSGDKKIANGAVIEQQFIKRDRSVHLQLAKAYSSQYAASGDNALIDGIKGGKEFRTGDWQGYYGTDVVATVTFDEARQLSQFGASMIRDQRSWIFFPKAISVEISEDGTNFKALPEIKIAEPNSKDKNPETLEFVVDSNATATVKAIRYVVKNSGVCPDWHLGKGNPTWLFLDELIFR